MELPACYRWLLKVVSPFFWAMARRGRGCKTRSFSFGCKLAGDAFSGQSRTERAGRCSIMAEVLVVPQNHALRVRTSWRWLARPVCLSGETGTSLPQFLNPAGVVAQTWRHKTSETTDVMPNGGLRSCGVRHYRAGWLSVTRLPLTVVRLGQGGIAKADLPGNPEKRYRY